jgi:hypothetical protein
VNAARRAARRLIQARLLLEEDAQIVFKRAEESTILR